MKRRLAGVVSLVLVATCCSATNTVITSFHSNGALSWTNPAEFSSFDVEWAGGINGPWTNSWIGLVGIVNTATAHTVVVPMFYRIVGHTQPASTLLIHADGTNGHTSFTDIHGHTIAALGDAHVSTNESVFGGASARLDGDNDLLSSPDSSDWAFGTNDFTVDLRIRFTAIASGNRHIIGLHDAGVDTDWVLFFNGGSLIFQTPAGDTGNAWSPTLNTWYHIAVTRESAYLRLFVDGDQLAAGTVTQNIGHRYALTIGASQNQLQDIEGYVDEIRIINGYAVWTTNFTPPAASYDQ